LGLLFLNIVSNPSRYLTILVGDKVWVHDLKLVVTKVRLDLCYLNVLGFIVLFVWSVSKLISRENITGSEYNLLVLWILDESNPLYSLFAYLKTKLFMSWALLALRHELWLNKLDRCILQAVHGKTCVLVADLERASFTRLILNFECLGENELSS
jgi:hypothetical protein